MANCFVTKLNFNSNDDSLPVAGEMRFKIQLIDSYSPDFIFGPGTAQITIACTNCASFKYGNKEGGETNPYTTQTLNGRYQLHPYDRNADFGWLSVKDKSHIRILGISKVVETNETLESMVNYMPELVELRLDGFNISGDLLSLADKTNLECLCLTRLHFSNGNVRNFINEMAKHRASGTSMQLAISPVESSFTNIPAAINGTYNGRFAFIYFNSSYPKGWYGRNPDGTYYNANDEVITP